MDHCSLCGHDDMVHFHFVGCCGVIGCPCRGIDGRDTCPREEHADNCWYFAPRLPKPPISREESDRIFALYATTGMGTRPLARELGLKRAFVVRVLHENWWPKPAGLPERPTPGAAT